jgi:hypothetical protein
VTTANGSATIKKELGTDNGMGEGVGADGRFTIDYNTGAGVAYLTTAPTDGDDLKAGYRHRTAGAGPEGLPTRILGEDIAAAAIAARDVVAPTYWSGTFNRRALIGYSAGYDGWLRQHGIYVKDALAA